MIVWVAWRHPDWQSKLPASAEFSAPVRCSTPYIECTDIYWFLAARAADPFAGYGWRKWGLVSGPVRLCPPRQAGGRGRSLADHPQVQTGKECCHWGLVELVKAVSVLRGHLLSVAGTHDLPQVLNDSS
jgi:hypothetical protein